MKPRHTSSGVLNVSALLAALISMIRQGAQMLEYSQDPDNLYYITSNVISNQFFPLPFQ